MKKVPYFFVLQFLIIYCFFSFTANSQTISVSGTIYSNTTWNADTVKITGDVFINDHISVTITPHTYVEFTGFYQIYSQGSIHASGTISDTITFAINDTTGYANADTTSGSWNSIIITPVSASNDSSIFEYCKFANSRYSAISGNNSKIRIEHNLFCYNNWSVQLYGNTTPLIRNNYFNTNMVAISASSCNPLITNNYFFNNNIGMVLYHSVAEVSYNVISNNTEIGLYLHTSGGSWIHNNEITYNVQGLNITFDTNSVVSNNNISSNNNPVGTGGGLFISNAVTTIINNTITYNTALGAAGIFVSGNARPLIISNKISNNHTTGTSCGATDCGAGIFCELASPYIVNNLIINNVCSYMGGGIACLDSCDVMIVNNTIANNTANSVFGGGGISAWHYGTANLKNNIIWGNKAPNSSTSKDLVLNFVSPGSINIDHCDISDTVNTYSYVGAGYSNLLMANPLFVMPTLGSTADWSLKSTSPCIDAGTSDTTGLHLGTVDMAGNLRISGSQIDIGAYEFGITTGITGTTNFKDDDFQVFPNPATDNVHIVVNKTGAKSILLRITNVLGEVVYNEHMTSATSFYNGTIDLSGYENGCYFVTITDDKNNSSAKVIIKR